MDHIAQSIKDISLNDEKQKIEFIKETRVEKKTSEFAYVCLVMKGDLYVPGAIVAAHSIRETGTKYDIVCMVTPDVSPEGVKKLHAVFDYVHQVDYIERKTKHLRSKKIENRYGYWKSVSYTKARMLQLTQYKKTMFMDSDLVVVENIDTLFELPTPAGTFSLSQAKPFKTKGLYNPFAKYGHAQTISPNDVKKGFKTFVCIGTSLVLEPSEEHFQQYLKMLTVMEPFGFDKCVNGPDEQSIVWFYHTVLGAKWTHIHQAYNMIPWKEKTWMVSKGQFGKPFVLHYVCEDKPWKLARDEWEDLGAWWRFADDAVRCYPVLEDFWKV